MHNSGETRRGNAESHLVVIARSEATKQSIVAAALVVDCFAALAMTVLKPFWLFESLNLAHTANPSFRGSPQG